MRILLILFILNIVVSPVLAQKKIPQLKEGDLVFQDLDCGPLCDAIEAVTQGYQGRDFSHVAIIVKIDGQLRAVEAIGSHVKSTPIDSLFMRCPKKFLVMRLIPEYEYIIPKVSKYSINKIGIPYDNRFIMDNDSLYCSELVYYAYNNAIGNNDIFQLQPMTYKNPHKQTFFPAWINYYKELKSNIPEGLMGINPGLISRSPYLFEVLE